MSSNENEQPNNQTAGQPSGAFGKDKKFGNRLDQVVAIGEPFLLLGARDTGELIDTAYGPAESWELLIQRLNKESGVPQGPPLRASTVLSAVVEKCKALTQEELEAGPICQLQVVSAKARGGKPATVMSWMRNLADKDDFSEFGIDPSRVSQIGDLARPSGERIPY